MQIIEFKINWDTSSNLIWWVQMTFLKILASPTIVRIENLEICNGESSSHQGELQESLEYKY